MTSPAGAQGYMQFMPETARQYGVNPHDEGSSIQGAQRYLSDLKGQFQGDIIKAVAAYNWGPGNVARVVSQYGSRWLEHIPAETQKYLAEVIGG